MEGLYRYNTRYYIGIMDKKMKTTSPFTSLASPSKWCHLSYNSNSLNGVISGIMSVNSIGVIEGATRNKDYSSFRGNYVMLSEDRKP